MKDAETLLAAIDPHLRNCWSWETVPRDLSCHVRKGKPQLSHFRPPTLDCSTEMPEILRVTEMEQVGTYSLKVTFNDGTSKRVNLRPLLWGEVFEPLRDPDKFSEVYLDEKMGTVAWPNGADLAPEALHELEDEQAVA